QVLDVVAEGVEEVGVEEDVEPAAVEELVGEQGVDRLAGLAHELAGHDRPVAVKYEPLDLGDVKEGEQDEEAEHEPGPAARGVVDLDRELGQDLRGPDHAAPH